MSNYTNNMFDFYKDVSGIKDEYGKSGGGTVMRNKFAHSMNGFNVDEVDNYIDNLKKDQDEKLTDMILALDDAAQENEVLNKKIDELKAELEEKSKSAELMDYAIKKAAEWAAQFSENSKKKAAELERLGREQEAVLNKKIETYSKALKSSTEKLSFLLSLEMEKEDSFIGGIGNVIPEEGTSSVKTSENDGVPNFYNVSDSASSEEPITPKVQDEVKVKDNGTKGKFENMFLEITYEEKNALIKGDTLNDNVIETDSFDDGFEDEVNDQQDLAEGNETDGEVEIENIRRKYIVGKIAGEDLHDGSGNIIIRKDNIISMETVAAAEREGKLASLIVDMKIPEGY